MKWAEAFTYFWMIVAWVFGIAVALKSGVMWCLLAILVPPVAWVFLAAHILSAL